jgi:hypothetical protein
MKSQKMTRRGSCVRAVEISAMSDKTIDQERITSL